MLILISVSGGNGGAVNTASEPCMRDARSAPFYLLLSILLPPCLPAPLTVLKLKKKDQTPRFLGEKRVLRQLVVSPRKNESLKKNLADSSSPHNWQMTEPCGSASDEKVDTVERTLITNPHTDIALFDRYHFLVGWNGRKRYSPDIDNNSG
ncbi:hypothetical protein BJV74DRAFT_510256 [Russula compacta]|nr:hypothetical protein BJV74DRAFT_510256 [Russula compacta]